MEIHKNECALRKLSKFHVSKAFQLRQPSTVYILPLLMCTRNSLVPRSWYCSAVYVTTCYYCYILSLGQIVDCFYWLRINHFSGSSRLLWIRVSLQSVMLWKHECHFVSGIGQSNFCILHNTTESVIICWWNIAFFVYWYVIHVLHASISQNIE